MPDSTIADELKAARALLAKGWCQHALERNGSYCAFGAINKAVTGDAMSYGAGQRLGPYAAIMDIVPGCDIAAFNNAETTTQQDVLNLFDKALAELGALA